MESIPQQLKLPIDCQETTNDESLSKQMYKITLICQSPLPLISRLGAALRTTRHPSHPLHLVWLSTLQELGDLHVTRMEVEEVNHSQK